MAIAQWTGQPRVKGGSESMQIALLTTSMFVWGTEMSECGSTLIAAQSLTPPSLREPLPPLPRSLEVETIFGVGGWAFEWFNHAASHWDDK
ncbi:hypothetical protein LTR22_017443 [Elasticomyces elasticus]|nr:hypothetical protein LTR22_017443 [Elasticomyces elasticus]KAK4924594.1 hypothetical protein LTR49_008277 [Elasticomyces elasticus]